MNSKRRLALLRAGRVGAAALVLIGMASIAQAGKRTLKLPNTRLEPITWAQVDGWVEDDHDAAFAAFLISCRAILQGARGSRPGKPMYAALHDVCRRAVEARPQKPGEARSFFEQNFRPTRISPLDDPDGFITGYYEPIVEGVRQQAEGYEYPLYRKPPSLAGRRMAVASASRHRGKSKKVRKRKYVAFHDRAAIDDGALAGRNLEICWLKDPIDAFFAHIQGSVRVRLEDGELMRLNYQAANGHPYVAVGKFLIERDIIPKDEMSMDRIREWMERNPDEGRELRRKNKSYVFFRETNLASNEEPVGAQGISLTPGRSIAVDRHLHVYGTPFFISAMLPIDSLKPTTQFRRLMIAQDTGGAIIGPARADIYFGAGDEAGSISGRLRHNGRFVMLLPKELDPTAGEGPVPLPRPRPPVAVVGTTVQPGTGPDGAAVKREAKLDIGKQERRKAEASKAKPAKAQKPTKRHETKNPKAKERKVTKQQGKQTKSKAKSKSKSKSATAEKSARNRAAARSATARRHDVGGAGSQAAGSKPAVKQAKNQAKNQAKPRKNQP
jgi:membrane-bound lytic murein transglycosylase A